MRHSEEALDMKLKANATMLEAWPMAGPQRERLLLRRAELQAELESVRGQNTGPVDELGAGAALQEKSAQETGGVQDVHLL